MSVSFNGSTQYANNAAPTGIPANNAPQSVVLRFMLTASPGGGNHQIFGFFNGVTMNSIQIGFRSGVFLVWAYGGGTYVSSGGGLSVNVWHVAVYTFDGTTHKLFIDGGAPYTSGSPPQTGSVAELLLGAYPTGEYFTGIVDEARVYDRALSNNEALSICNQFGMDDVYYGRIDGWSLDEEAPGVAVSGSLVDNVGPNDLSQINSPVYGESLAASRRRAA